MALFHNTRTLHGRRAFAAGARDVVGCFVSEDDLLSRFRTLRRFSNPR